MDSFFGIGTAELAVILLLAGLVMGPQQIRDVARKLGRWTARLQAISRQFARQLNAELDAIDGDKTLKNTAQEVLDLRQEFAEFRRDMLRMPQQVQEEMTTAVVPPPIPPPSTNGTPAPKEALTPPLPSLPSIAPPDLPRLVDVADDPNS